MMRMSIGQNWLSSWTRRFVTVELKGLAMNHFFKGHSSTQVQLTHRIERFL